MAQKPFNTNAAIRSAIRRVFSRSPAVRETMFKVRREVAKYNKDGSRAKKDAVQYQCNVCKAWTKSTAISVDHIVPVISVEDGFEDWNTFVDRLFCGPSNLQVICDPCHNAKTNQERLARAIKQSSAIVTSMESSWVQPTRDISVAQLKKFTKKKIAKYPQDLKDRITALKLKFGLKV